MDNKHAANPPATLYYDGHCSLCNREMARLAALKDDGLRLQDIHSITDFDALPDKDTLLRNLHLKTAQGRILTGVDANVAAWQATRYGRLFRWMRWPLIRPLADAVYRIWALWRYRRLYDDKESQRQ